eukprot:CAMPEP_0115000460 /NCGR_PEP_ID=MMETSP0216-20121206/16773_1 /TAXON_ID=223996 /ORGANISM="Protocruzia adherens, Strain Boccale" /LENGTH=256 /DNA_ID=CAMNT_0002365567 /DNA_START=692 /DNA_END=1462 /DNA_ORIENTATION=-
MSLEREIETIKQRHEYELERLTLKYESKLEAAIDETEYEIKKLKNENADLQFSLKNESEKLLGKSEDFITQRQTQERELNHLRELLKERDTEIQRLKDNNYESSKEQMRKYELDKKKLCTDYEELIKTMKQDFIKAKDELLTLIQNKENVAKAVENDSNDLKREFGQQLEKTQKEIMSLHETLTRNKKIHETQLEDHRLVLNMNDDLKKENDILQTEISLLEGEQKRVKRENDDLKNALAKYDGMIYGKRKTKKRQ